MYFGMFDPTIIILIPAMLFAVIAQRKVNKAYNTFSAVQNRNNISGDQAARKVLDANGLQNVKIEMTKGRLTDHYDPRQRVMRLSADVYNGTSIAAVSIAAHESGHAIQHGVGYAFLSIRNAIAPVVNIVSMLSWPLLIIGILVGNLGRATAGNFIFDLGIFFFAGVVIFHLITLPVELNASKRATKQLQDLNIVTDGELVGAKKVLSAAAMTYVAALASAVASLVRILLIRERD
ncbi:MAG: zinc metallopeptidase [Anaerovoracaceae bacterium]